MKCSLVLNLAYLQACVQMYWKQLLTITRQEVVMYSVVSSILAKLSTALIIGSFLVI